MLKEGDEVEVGLEDGIVIIKPLIDKEKFVNELKGCVEISKINPLEVKKYGKPDLYRLQHLVLLL